MVGLVKLHSSGIAALPAHKFLNLKAMTTIEGNILIAEFMGFVKWYDSNEFMGYEQLDTLKFNAQSEGMGSAPHAVTFDQLRFNESWDWLMPVIDKIHSSDKYAKYKDSLGPFSEGIFINTKYIESTFNDVVDYIIWNNV